MVADSSRFQRWTTEGQLLTVVMGATFLTCLYFWIFVDPATRPEVLNQVLLAVLGLWGTNLGYGVKARNDREKSETRAKEDAEFQRRVDEAVKRQMKND
jgi:hypothetical protein